MKNSEGIWFVVAPPENRSLDSSLVKIDPETGELEWEKNIDDKAFHRFQEGDFIWFFASTDDDKVDLLTKMDAETGEVLAETEVAEPDSRPVIHDGFMWIIEDIELVKTDGEQRLVDEIVKIDIETLEEVDKFDMRTLNSETDPEKPYFYNNKLWILGKVEHFSAIDPDTKQEIFQTDFFMKPLWLKPYGEKLLLAGTEVIENKAGIFNTETSYFIVNPDTGEIEEEIDYTKPPEEYNGYPWEETTPGVYNQKDPKTGKTLHTFTETEELEFEFVAGNWIWVRQKLEDESKDYKLGRIKFKDD